MLRVCAFENDCAISVALYADGENADGLYADGLNADGLYADGLNADGLYAIGLYADGLYADGEYTSALYADGLNADGLYADGLNADGLKADGPVRRRTERRRREFGGQLSRLTVFAVAGLNWLRNAWPMSLNTARL